MAEEKLAARLCLVVSDQGKHGSALKNLNSQRHLKSDQFPKTIADDSSVSSNHEFDKSFDKSEKKSWIKKKADDEDESQEKELAFLFSQTECVRCFCIKKGQTSTTHHLKGKLPNDQWGISKSKSQFLQ